MATIDSLKNGIRILELVAEAGAPVSTPDLIERCSDFVSASQVRNSADTLADLGWLQKVKGEKGLTLYGLGGKAARLWAIYLGLKVDDLDRKNQAQAEELSELRRMVELGREA